MDKELIKQRGRGIYLLPNLLTTTGLFTAFYAIVAAMKGHFDTALIAIFIAMIADGMDGRVARLTNTQSAFGAEYDSISDMVAFGIAPALVAYSWSLSSIGKIGWLAAFVYVSATALRLARFNTQLEEDDKRYFKGLACPSAAGVIASTVWIAHQNGIDGHKISHFMVALAVLTAILMVSNVNYYSFKELNFKDKVPFVWVLMVVVIVVGIALDPPLVLFCGFSIYALSGPVITLWCLIKSRRTQKRSPKK